MPRSFALTPYNPVTFATGKHAKFISVLRLCPGFGGPCPRGLRSGRPLRLDLRLDTREAAERVGVAAAVTPAATSQPPGAAMSTLKIGKSVVYNERIDTSGSGVVQVLLLDGSTFTVGPGSSLVIDKFVYDPKSGKGALVASFSKGALRFVGGKLSKEEPGISVKTPAGVLTVRGGMFQGWIAGPNKALIAFLYGNHLSLARGGHLYTLSQTGNVFAISGPGAPVIRPVNDADTAFLLAAVSGKKLKYASSHSREGAALALLLRHPAFWPLSGPALHQGALLRHGRRRHRPQQSEAGADSGADAQYRRAAGRGPDAHRGGAAQPPPPPPRRSSSRRCPRPASMHPLTPPSFTPAKGCLAAEFPA